MTHPRYLLLALLVSGCVTEVEVIEDNESCAEGAFHPAGQPRLTGDDCYDEWARRMAGLREDLVATAQEITPSCVALATARGAEDTWSAELDPVRRAALACAAAEAPGGDGPSCDMVGDQTSCAFEVSCDTTATSPDWHHVFEAEAPRLMAVCCEFSKMDLLVEPLALAPSCGPGAGTEACASRLVDDTGLYEFLDVVGVACGTIEVLSPSP